MTTSDSEDFESADEEIDPDPSTILSKYKSSIEKETVSNENIEPVTTACATKSEDSKDQKSNDSDTADLSLVSRGVSDLALHKKDESKLNEDDSTNSNEPISESTQEKRKETDHGRDETQHEEKVVEGSEATSSCAEESDVKVSSSESSNERSARGQRNRRPPKSKENKSGPMKLGVRVTPVRDTSAENKNVEITENSSSNVSEGIENSDKKTEAPSSRIPHAPFEKIESDNIKEKVESQKQEPAEQTSGWGFGKSLIGSSTWSSMGGWGSSILNTATLSVSTLGSHVTQGISTVLETVEAGIGAPSPEELALKLKEEEEKKKAEGKGPTVNKVDEDEEAEELEMDEAWGDWKDDEGQGDTGNTGTGLFSLVTGVTQVTGKVLSTGLGTLETIGKKTMEVLQEGDPGLKKKRALLLGNDDTVILSQVLREAKEKAEAEALLAEEKEAMRKAHFETLFDDFQGLVHLEALEMLSRQSDLRLKSLLLKETGPPLRALQIRLAAVQELCEIPDNDDEEESSACISESLPVALKSLKIDISGEKVIKSCKDSFDKLEDMKKESEAKNESKVMTRIIHQQAIQALAILTANSIELFHKVTELLLVKEGKGRDVKDEAKTMADITAVLTSEVNKIAAAYSDFLSTKLSNDSLTAEDKEKIESSITSIFLEASNSSTYIQDAFQLMVPILQCGAVA